ncbi:MAG: universal stress protein [Solirubrobacteraceae bacterium]|jgi:nucleotide-binding universal stress UspA family protein
MIVLCYDGSASAKHAIATAHSLVGQAPALVLHVWEPPMSYLGPDPFGGLETWSGPQIVELEALSTERANRTVEYGVQLARDAGFSAEGRLERATHAVWRTILDVADETDAQLIVAGARGLSTIQSLLLGSVSAALVHHSTRPMLVVPSTPSEPQADS